MSIVLDGRGVPLRKVMMTGVYTSFTREQLQELLDQLQDAAINSARPGRRAQYGVWAQAVVELLDPEPAADEIR